MTTPKDEVSANKDAPNAKPEDKPNSEEALGGEESQDDPSPEAPIGGSGEAAAQGQDSSGQTLEEALAEAERYKDLASRAQADVENIQKRAAREVEQARKYALERFLHNLLPVVDSIEKAIEAAEAAQGKGKADPITEGIRLCHKLLTDVMAKEGIESLEPLGEPFDPNEHQAMAMIEHSDMEPNSVLTVAQKGYKLNGRLVRPAMVTVTQATNPDEPQGAAVETNNQEEN